MDLHEEGCGGHPFNLGSGCLILWIPSSVLLFSPGTLSLAMRDTYDSTCVSHLSRTCARGIDLQIKFLHKPIKFPIGFVEETNNHHTNDVNHKMLAIYGVLETDTVPCAWSEHADGATSVQGSRQVGVGRKNRCISE